MGPGRDTGQGCLFLTSDVRGNTVVFRQLMLGLSVPAVFTTLMNVDGDPNLSIFLNRCSCVVWDLVFLQRITK